MNDSGSYTPQEIVAVCHKMGIFITEWQANFILAVRSGEPIELRRGGGHYTGHIDTWDGADVRHILVDEVHEAWHRWDEVFENLNNTFAEVFEGFNEATKKTTSRLRDVFGILADVFAASPKSPRHALPRRREKKRSQKTLRMAYVPKRKVVRGMRR